MTFRTRLLTASVITAALVSVVMLAAMPADSRTLGATQSRTAPNGFPAFACSRPADQEAARTKQLGEFVRKSRSLADREPLLWADVGYYQAEYAASRRCAPSVAETQ